MNVTVDLTQFQEWKAKHRLLYSFCKKRNVRLWVYLNGNMAVEKEGKIIWQGIQPWNAVEEFNNA
jgi:hypothetical protein